VLATKFTMARDHGDPNSGGNHRMNMMRSVEESLRQLDTDRIELLYLHGWDFTTAPDEVMRGLDDLVRGAKVLCVGICNTPAWQIARMQTVADLRGWTPLIALQIEYSLIERTVEHELIPMAAELGLGVLPWSPLGGGMLSGKYGTHDLAVEAEVGISASRKGIIVASGHMTARALTIADTVVAIAGELGATASQVAIAWLLARKSVTAPVIGARTVEQLIDNLGALDVNLGDEHLLRLDQASAPPPTFPDRFMSTPMLRHLIFGGTRVQGRA
jgi:aryl-alcohol dehydrogenase-like predicted oxidoreductase